MGWIKGIFKAGWTWLSASSIELYALAALVLFGVGFGVGIDWAEGSQAEAELQQLKVVQRAYVDAIVRGQRDVNALNTNLNASTAYAKTLKERLRHAQLIAALPVPSSDAAAQPGGDVQPGGQPAAAHAAGAASPVLSAAAVSLWNSALAGADVPTGACRSADTTDPACAAAAGLTVDDAWENQGQNAESCRADRIRYQQLIDHLNTTRPDSTRSNP